MSALQGGKEERGEEGLFNKKVYTEVDEIMKTSLMIKMACNMGSKIFMLVIFYII